MNFLYYKSFFSYIKFYVINTPLYTIVNYRDYLEISYLKWILNFMVLFLLIMLMFLIKIRNNDNKINDSYNDNNNNLILIKK